VDVAEAPDGAGEGRRILTVRQLNEQIQAALQNAFAAPVWVRGEVQRLAPDAARRQHVYFELHEAGRSGAAGYQIPAAILGWDRDRHGLGRYLDGSDPAFRLQDKLEVCLRCRVDFYPPYGRVNLRVIGIDLEFSLGQLERQRRQVLAWLEARGLLALNAARPLADLPLRVGLVTSRGSAAAEDVRASLAASGFPFRITVADCRMQGEQTAPQIIAALHRLAALPLDVVLIARGGGSRADLSWFDQADLCEAIARCPLPVVTAIGHEIDTSLADLCAHTRCKTPTAAAGFLIERLQRAEQRLAAAAGRLASAVPPVVADARRRLDGCGRLAPLAVRRLAAGRGQVRTLAAALEGRTARAVARRQRQLLVAAGRLVHGGRLTLAAARRRTDYLAGQSIRQAPRAAAVQGRRLAATAAALAAPARRLVRERAAALDLLAARTRGLDPVRLLERGFTLTLDAQGRLLRLASAVQPGQLLRTRFADGEVASVARETTSPAATAPAGRKRGRKRQGGKDGDEEGSGQQALF
jgi:exodeoxyribonuclease VII large subunit